MRQISMISALLLVYLFGGARASTQGMPDPGPENSGLRLRLALRPDQTAGVYIVTVELLNVGTSPVTLLAAWPYEHQTGDYAAFLEQEVRFLTYPEVMPESFQTAGRFRRTPQPECQLDPAQSIKVSWTTSANHLKPQRSFPGTNIIFPSPGLYGIKAIVTVLTKQGSRILLLSNEQAIMIGDRPIRPKFATAQIVEPDPNSGMVTLDLGSDHRIEPGDSFRIRHMFLAMWQATVTEVSQVSCRAAVKTMYYEGGPSFPQPGWKARLEPRSNN